MSVSEFLENHPTDRNAIDAEKARMLDEVRAYRLRELRVRAGLTQAELAARIGVGQRQVSKIEHGELDNARVGTIRRYLEAVGGGLSVEFLIGDEHVRVA
ncbi:helix-turn-helix domain-containing protein [Mycetocola tolaasinivorans]|nr:helix-turn-helix transcriptional regulator [Mycetocola tolaasinivorans]